MGQRRDSTGTAWRSNLAPRRLSSIAPTPSIARLSFEQRQRREQAMRTITRRHIKKWSKPSWKDKRFGFEMTMYVLVR